MNYEHMKNLIKEAKDDLTEMFGYGAALKPELALKYVELVKMKETQETLEDIKAELTKIWGRL